MLASAVNRSRPTNQRRSRAEIGDIKRVVAKTASAGPEVCGCKPKSSQNRVHAAISVTPKTTLSIPIAAIGPLLSLTFKRTGRRRSCPSGLIIETIVR